MFGERIRLLRTQENMTQDELGKILGVGKTTVSQYESETRTPDAAMLDRLATVFRVSVDYLLGRTDDPTPPPARHDEAVESKAAHRIDDPLADLPEEARRSLREFQEYVLQKYRGKTE